MFQSFQRFQAIEFVERPVSKSLDISVVWAYHEWCVRLYVKRAFTALFFPEISPHFILFTLSCLREMAFRMLQFSSTVSRLVASNPWNFWCENYSLSDQIRRRTACIFRHELS